MRFHPSTLPHTIVCFNSFNKSNQYESTSYEKLRVVGIVVNDLEEQVEDVVIMRQDVTHISKQGHP